MDLFTHIVALQTSKDEQAFEAIYHQTKHAVYAMILPIVQDRFLVEDVMQETYVKMIENIRSYNPRYSFINWLLTIAKNHAIDTIRKKKPIYFDSTESLNWLADYRGDIEKKMIVEHYLSVLNATERHVVLLRTVGELKHKDIAKLLNKPLGTILWMYNQALSKLKAKAKEDNHE